MPVAGFPGALTEELQRQLSLYAPGAFYVSGEDHLRISSISAATGGVVFVSGRFLTTGGEIVPFRHRHAANADRTEASTDVSLGYGWLLQLHVAVDESTSTVPRGQMFVRVQVVRGITGATVVLGTLVQGYPAEIAPLAFPGSPIAPSLDGKGRTFVITGTDPAAGVEISETVPTGAVWRIRSLSATLVTDGTATTRRVALVIDDGTNDFFSGGTGDSMGASLTVRLTFFVHSGSTASDQTDRVHMPIVPVDLHAGFRIRTDVENFQAGDNWGAPTLIVEEWLEP